MGPGFSEGGGVPLGVDAPSPFPSHIPYVFASRQLKYIFNGGGGGQVRRPGLGTINDVPYRFNLPVLITQFFLLGVIT